MDGQPRRIHACLPSALPASRRLHRLRSSWPSLPGCGIGTSTHALWPRRVVDLPLLPLSATCFTACHPSTPRTVDAAPMAAGVSVDRGGGETQRSHREGETDMRSGIILLGFENLHAGLSSDKWRSVGLEWTD
jgi:hypothetical protein